VELPVTANIESMMCVGRWEKPEAEFGWTSRALAKPDITKTAVRLATVAVRVRHRTLR
jgi:hypothetical protein